MTSSKSKRLTTTYISFSYLWVCRLVRAQLGCSGLQAPGLVYIFSVYLIPEPRKGPVAIRICSSRSDGRNARLGQVKKEMSSLCQHHISSVSWTKASYKAKSGVKRGRVYPSTTRPWQGCGGFVSLQGRVETGPTGQSTTPGLPGGKSVSRAVLSNLNTHQNHQAVLPPVWNPPPLSF